MYLVGSREQQARHFKFKADGSATGSGSPVLVLPERKSTSMLIVQNISGSSMYLEFGSATATCTISGGAVNAITVTNGGFGFTYAPGVEFFGGGNSINFNNNYPNSQFIGVGLYSYPAPAGGPAVGTITRPAQAHAVLSGGVVTSIVIDDGGAGYVAAPQVFLANSIFDPNGCADPSKNGGSGILLLANGGSYYVNGTACTTDPMAIYSAATSGAQKFTCRWMP